MILLAYWKVSTTNIIFYIKNNLLREKGAVYGEFIFEPLVDSPRLTFHVDIFRCRGFFRGKERE